MSRVLKTARGPAGTSVYFCLEDVIALGPVYYVDVEALRHVHLVSGAILPLCSVQADGPLVNWFQHEETPMQHSGTFPELTKRVPKGKGKKR